MAVAEEEAKGLNQQEERELRRVFDHMANFVPKRRIQDALGEKRSRADYLEQAAAGAGEGRERILDEDGNVMNDDQVAEETSRLAAEMDELQAQLARLENNPLKKIRPVDLSEGLRALGKSYTRKQIEYMIWEVDEDLDGCVNWDEFRLMFQRNVTDTSGLEPFQLFNVVQFMTYDKDFTGRVTVDDTMSMLYARYGREQLETQMKLLFGDNLKSENGDGELTIEQYLKAVSVRKPGQRRRLG